MAGPNVASIYLLVTGPAILDSVRHDLEAELKVQLQLNLRSLQGSAIRPENFVHTFGMDPSGAPVLVLLDEWLPKLAASLDRNVILLSGTVLLLAIDKVARRLLAVAPNLRSRLTDVLTIGADQAFGGTRE